MTKEVTCKFCKHERTVFTGNEILLFRKRNKLSLRQLAKELNVSISFLNDCEHDRRNCSSAMYAFFKMYDVRHMVFKKELGSDK